MPRAAILALALVLIPAVALADITGPATIIDGDTLIVAGERIRLYALDAPERRQPCYDEARYSWKCGAAAAEALAGKIAGRPVSCERRDVDRYGRTVATCSVDGDDLGRWLVLRGLAVADRRYSLDYVGEEHEAREAKAGIWAGSFMWPWEWRRGAGG